MDHSLHQLLDINVHVLESDKEATDEVFNKYAFV